MSQIKGLIFDLDGTLTLTQHFHFLAYQQVFKDHGVDYSREDDYRYAGQGAHCIFPKIFAEKGRTLTPEEIEQYAAEKKTIYTRMLDENELETVPGIQQFLEKMQERGLKMAVASGNRPDSLEYILQKTGLRKYFLALVTNHDVKNSKPAPDIFLKAAELLDLKPQECIVFEDAVSGVTAAKAAGMGCIALLTGSDKQKLLEAGADAAVLNYDEISVSCFLEKGIDCLVSQE